MSKLMLTPDLKAQFSKLLEATELVDENGQSIGRFVPQSALDRTNRPASDDELRRRMAANERTYSTAEVLRHLESL